LKQVQKLIYIHDYQALRTATLIFGFFVPVYRASNQSQARAGFQLTFSGSGLKSRPVYKSELV